jgi:hypothetical protein
VSEKGQDQSDPEQPIGSIGSGQTIRRVIALHCSINYRIAAHLGCFKGFIIRTGRPGFVRDRAQRLIARWAVSVFDRVLEVFAARTHEELFGSHHSLENLLVRV